MTITKYAFHLNYDCPVPLPVFHLSPSNRSSTSDQGVSHQVDGLSKISPSTGVVVQYQLEARENAKGSPYIYFGISFSDDPEAIPAPGYEPYFDLYQDLCLALWRTIYYLYNDGNSTISSTHFTLPVDWRGKSLAYTSLE